MGEEIFGEGGLAFNQIRVPMGASDFALDWWSLNETV